ncbi:Cdc6/Cdc18 family protein [Haloglomus litoreum]|uniref:Cdc6/Cdc18 family protein n=1 Tax=Haloglomus litoreum TaxID=3034026 RepID=UPI0023E82C68|nr:AAA family ATPase [Haloglomus sp. DT116]
MDLKTRIRRRQRSGADSPVVRDYEAISPVAHVEEPTGRGPAMEQLLDYLDPVFDAQLPTDAYVWGPAGSGKSAVITALFAHLSRLLSGSATVIHTSTRAQSAETPAFVYVDARRSDSAFGLYHAVLDGMLDESVPRHGVGTETIRDRLVDHLRPVQRRAVVVVDHVNETGGLDLATLAETFSVVDDSLACVAVGRDHPDDLSDALRPPERIEMPSYERHALVDLLTARASDGLSQGAIDHEQIRRLADWAEGDAHDALAALFGAADLADMAGYDRVREQDLTDGMNAVPRPSAPLGRVHTLPANRQLVLRRLVDLDDSQTGSVDDTAAAITEARGVDLSAGTVKRFLYELAETGVVQRVTAPATSSAGRPPSRLEPRFPTLVFRRLYDLEHG